MTWILQLILQRICQICRPDIDNNPLKQCSSLNVKWALWRRIPELDYLLQFKIWCCKSAGRARSLVSCIKLNNH